MDGRESDMATQTLQRPESSDDTCKPDLAARHLHLQHVSGVFVVKENAVVLAELPPALFLFCFCFFNPK